GLVYALESGDRSFRNASEVESATGLSVLGISLAAPSRSRFAMVGFRRTRAPVSSFLLNNPSSALSESLRLTRVAIASSRSDRVPKTVMVTSAVPGEGKTTFTMMLGRQSAANGKRTIVIEAEMRRPKFARELQGLPAKGLSDYLAGRANLDEIIGLDGA